MRYGIGAAVLIVALAAGCGKPTPKAPEGILFKDDLAFLESHTKPVVLIGANGLAQVAVNPDLQGRVMTSTADGTDGLSFGWINRELLASGVNNPHINAFGGEDRFWIGPEGGQFSIFSGPAAWAKETGLLSIWILGMFNPSPETTIVVPFKSGPEAELGPAVNDAYFGKVPGDRLVVKDGVLFFSGDGKFRSKIGISPARVKPFAGSYDAANKVLTVVHLTIHEGAGDYVNSMWEIQEKPFAGDVVNSYNDGPASPGAKPLGPFYELESSSPAAALGPGETLAHVHTTMHFQGPEKALDQIARTVFGVGLEEIEKALTKK
jgi:hypothetical protein